MAFATFDSLFFHKVCSVLHEYLLFLPLSQNKLNFEYTSFSDQVTRIIITRFICMGFSFVFLKLDNTIL